MTELIVNLALLLAVLVVVVTLAIGGLRRRRTERLRQNDERSLILQAFIAAAPPPFAPSPAAAQPDVTPPAAVPNPVGQPSQLDVQSVVALLDLLEGRPPTRRGLARSVISSPRSIWSAGETAGRQAGQRTMAGSRPGPADNAAGELYRDAATELVEIFCLRPARRARAVPAVRRRHRRSRPGRAVRPLGRLQRPPRQPQHGFRRGTRHHPLPAGPGSVGCR